MIDFRRKEERSQAVKQHDFKEEGRGAVSETRTDRKIVDTRNTPYEPYDRYGINAASMSWIPVSMDEETGKGCFMIRIEPGGRSLPHVHTGGEYFLMLEGELIDDDGTVFKAGDFVSFAPGSSHSSHSPTGCVAAVFLGGMNRLVDEADES